MAVDYKINTKDVQPYLDPTTLAPQIRHPLIYFSMNDIKFHLKPEVHEWLVTTCKDRWSFKIEEKDYFIHFENDADETIFRLHWL